MTLLCRSPRLLLSAALLLALGVCPGSATALPSSVLQAPATDLTPVQWAEQAAAQEEAIVNYDPHLGLRYRVHRRDAKGEVVREIIDSTDGPVARLLGRDGHPLTQAEDLAERERLQGLLNDPDAFFRHQHREQGSRSYAIELLRAMPRAMLWSFVAGQPQLPNAPGPAIVLDFKPDPNFKSPSLITEGLTGIAGRIWVDQRTHVVTRIQGSILHPVDFGWGGLFARIREGGALELEQTKAANGRWLYSHLVEHLTIREVLVHSVSEDAETTATDIQPLSTPVPYRIAIEMLLAIPVETR